jgi:hypothetical protein
VTSIRHYMTIVESMLLEGVNLGKMFNGLLAHIEDEREKAELLRACDAAAAWAQEVLKTDDRVTWYLNLFKICRFSLVKDGGPAFDEAYAKQLGEYLRKTAGSKGAWHYRGQIEFVAEYVEHDVRQHLQHYLSLPAPAIQNYRFLWKSLNEVQDDLSALEESWKEKRKRFIPHQDENTVLSFPDGYQWELLDRASCEAEGDAMGHCGNTGDPREGDRILSLRRIVTQGDEKFWEPSLTFILNKHGMLGEMKGRGNEKPAGRYHKYIVPLLKLPLIKGIDGGGYLPENNFTLNDLGPEAKEQILAAKPDLGTLADIYRRAGVTDVLKARIMRRLDGLSAPYVRFTNDGSKLNLREFENWQDVAQEKGDRSTKRFAELDGESFADDFDMGPSDSDAEHVFDKLPKNMRARIGAAMQEKYPDDIEAWEDEEGTHYDPNYDAFAIIKYTSDDLFETLMSAAEQGKQAAKAQETEKAISDAFSDYDFPFDGMSFHWDNETGRFAWGDRICVAIDTDDLCDLLSDDRKSKKVEETDWMVEKFHIYEPSHGFGGFDTNAAIQHVIDAYPEYAKAAA